MNAKDLISRFPCDRNCRASQRRAGLAHARVNVCSRVYVIVETMEETTVSPARSVQEREQLMALYHVVLLDDDEHTYDYVIEMLQRLFLLSANEAFERALEVDTTGRAIVITCELPQAEFARDQIHSYGPDPRMPNSRASMHAAIEPARH